MTSETIPVNVLARWSRLADAAAKRIDSGLINDTFIVETNDGERAVVQRLHAVFPAEINLDIAAVTERLAAQGLTTPRLLPTDDDALWVVDDEQIWRALSYVQGATHQKVASAAMLKNAGGLVGLFHSALEDFEHVFHSNRNVHDTTEHLNRLQAALGQHKTHSLYASVSRLAESLFDSADELIEPSAVPPRNAHGDLKISNVQFDAEEHAICLIDLDTVSRMQWPLEMGDALRSWCNPRTEDEESAVFDLSLFEAALSGYATNSPSYLSREERELLVPGIQQISLELSARFLTDTLEETYFGWDASRYPSQGAHNLVRAKAMHELMTRVREQRSEEERIVRHCLG